MALASRPLQGSVHLPLLLLASLLLLSLSSSSSASSFEYWTDGECPAGKARGGTDFANPLWLRNASAPQNCTPVQDGPTTYLTDWRYDAAPAWTSLEAQLFLDLCPAALPHFRVRVNVSAPYIQCSFGRCIFFVDNPYRQESDCWVTLHTDGGSPLPSSSSSSSSTADGGGGEAESGGSIGVVAVIGGVGAAAVVVAVAVVGVWWWRRSRRGRSTGATLAAQETGSSFSYTTLA